MRARHRSAFAAAALIVAAASDAHATPAPAPSSVHWNEDWQRFRWWEGVLTAGFFVSTYAFESSLHPPSTANWSGPVLLDAPIRGLLRGRSPGVEKGAARYSDFLLKTAFFYPFIDAGLTLAIHRDADVAAQIALMDAESLGFAGAFSLFTERIVGRERPYVRDCGGEGTRVGNNPCGGDGDRISFFSGHASAAFTSAGLTCIHHQHLPLWGGGAPDTWACVWALSLASTTGLLRIVSDKHYASDVFTGAAVGLFSGYVVPALLHYGFGRAPPGRSAVSPVGVIRPALLPVPAGAAAGMHGVF